MTRRERETLLPPLEENQRKGEEMSRDIENTTFGEILQIRKQKRTIFIYVKNSYKGVVSHRGRTEDNKLQQGDLKHREISEYRALELELEKGLYSHSGGLWYWMVLLPVSDGAKRADSQEMHQIQPYFSLLLL